MNPLQRPNHHVHILFGFQRILQEHIQEPKFLLHQCHFEEGVVSTRYEEMFEKLKCQMELALKIIINNQDNKIWLFEFALESLT